ncbi:MAG TPA: type IX secretion system membrane protein PorP/SprF [Bacteroidales bacterium]|nr:type IX secretion system membrane protein PorP/SprF [Bacteroidales bacterium]
MNHYRRKDPGIFILLIILLMTGPGTELYSQQLPSYPVSLRIYDSFVLNPAIAGSKDFFNLDMSVGKSANINSQFIAGSSRIMRRNAEYPSTPALTDFTDFGAGGYVFREKYGLFNNSGFAGTVSYHKKLSDDALSFISAGISGKLIHTSYAGNTDAGIPSGKRTYADLDIGLYYYGPSFYAGMSVINVFSNTLNSDTAIYNAAGLSRHLNAIAGYKFVISRELNIVAEPAILLSENYSLSGNIKDMAGPMLRLYAGMFCAGAYFPGFDKASVFFRFKYPKFNIGAYLELPGNTPLYKSPILAEITLGINLSAIKFGAGGYNHW